MDPSMTSEYLGFIPVIIFWEERIKECELVTRHVLFKYGSHQGVPPIGTKIRAGVGLFKVIDVVWDLREPGSGLISNIAISVAPIDG